MIQGERLRVDHSSFTYGLECEMNYEDALVTLNLLEKIVASVEVEIINEPIKSIEGSLKAI